MNLLQAEVNGVKIIYTLETIFSIQMGKGQKGVYHTEQTFRAEELHKAILQYKELNLGSKYKKRLVMGAGKQVLASDKSE